VASRVVAGPTSSSARLPVLDVLRGIALFGIFTLNLAIFSGFIFMSANERAALPTAPLDLPAIVVIVWFGYGKFYSLFSLLFGIGFALQLESAVRAGDQRLRRFRRRLLVLLLIGFIHLTLVWDGDILTLYALVGFALIPLRRLSQRALVVTAAILIFLPVVEQGLIVISRGALDPGAPLLAVGNRWLVALGFEANASPYPLLRDAPLSEAVRFQVTGLWFRWADLLTTGRPFKVLAMFLLGLWAGRSGMLREPDPWVPLLRRVRLLGFAVGLWPAFVHALVLLRFVAHDSWWPFVGAVAYALGVAPLALAYAAHLALLWQQPIWRARLGWLAPAGRMALTNYVGQSVIAILAFYGLGLGLMGRSGPATWPVIAIIVVVLQALASRWWLERFRFGPMEWVWRRATYGRLAIGNPPQDQRKP
jgi:uncharacterized protein